jgi:hypothetical protein
VTRSALGVKLLLLPYKAVFAGVNRYLTGEATFEAIFILGYQGEIVRQAIIKAGKRILAGTILASIIPYEGTAMLVHTGQGGITAFCVIV